MAECEKVIEILEKAKRVIENWVPMFEQYNTPAGIDNAIAILKERKAENGDWITIWREDDPDTSSHARCSICNRISERPLGEYCKWCGAKMNQEWGIDG